MSDPTSSERIAIPIRAIPYATGWDLEPRAVAAAIAEAPDWEGRTFQTVLQAHYFDQDGKPRPMLFTESVDWARKVETLAQDSATRVEQINAMPAGIFVWESALHGLIAEVNATAEGTSTAGHYRPPVKLNLYPLLDGDQKKLVTEGFSCDGGVAVTSQTRPGRADGVSAGDLLDGKFSAALSPENCGAVPIPVVALQERRLTECQFERRVVKDLGQKVWAANMELEIVDVARSDAMRPYMRKYSSKTIRKWLAEVDPRPPHRRRGRKRRQPATA